MLTLWQAEWCPYSARVRQTLTELGLDFVARQVDADRQARETMRREAGRDSIPLLVLEDGTQVDDWREIVRWLREHHEPRPDAERHHEQWLEEAPQRDPAYELR